MSKKRARVRQMTYYLGGVYRTNFDYSYWIGLYTRNRPIYRTLTERLKVAKKPAVKVTLFLSQEKLSRFSKAKLRGWVRLKSKQELSKDAVIEALQEGRCGSEIASWDQTCKSRWFGMAKVEMA